MNSKTLEQRYIELCSGDNYVTWDFEQSMPSGEHHIGKDYCTINSYGAGLTPIDCDSVYDITVSNASCVEFIIDNNLQGSEPQILESFSDLKGETVCFNFTEKNPLFIGKSVFCTCKLIVKGYDNKEVLIKYSKIQYDISNRMELGGYDNEEKYDENRDLVYTKGCIFILSASTSP